VEWIRLAHDRAATRLLWTWYWTYGSKNSLNLLTIWATVSFSKRALFHGVEDLKEWSWRQVERTSPNWPGGREEVTNSWMKFLVRRYSTSQTFFFGIRIFIRASVRAKRIQLRLLHPYLLNIHFNIIYSCTLSSFSSSIEVFWVNICTRDTWTRLGSCDLPEIWTGYLPNADLRPSSRMLLSSSRITQHGIVRTKSNQLRLSWDPTWLRYRVLPVTGSRYITLSFMMCIDRLVTYCSTGHQYDVSGFICLPSSWPSPPSSPLTHVHASIIGFASLLLMCVMHFVHIAVFI
jgi:hypothetical protein